MSALVEPATRGRVEAFSFGLATAVVAGCLLFVTFPPLVDYPQHLAMASELHEVLAGRPGPRFVIFTYNGLFETSTALLAFALPIETAGRLVIATMIVVESTGVFLLVRRTGRPLAYAFLWFVGAYSFHLAWGFVNFGLSLGLATHVLAEWAGRRRPRCLAALALLTVHAHILGFALLVVALAAMLLDEVRRRGAISRGALAAFLPAAAWAVAAHLSSEPVHPLPAEFMWITTPLREKLAHLHDNVFGSLSGPWDERLFTVAGTAVAALVVAAVVTRRTTVWRACGLGLAWAACAVLYAALPYCIRGNWYVYHRPAAAAWLWLPAVLPVPRGRCARAFEAATVVLGLLSATLFASKILTQPERGDASAIVDAVPREARVIPVFYSWSAAPAVDGYAYVHHVAYAVTRRHAKVPAMFSRRFGSFPVRGRWSPGAKLPDVGFEWARSFDAEADYARYFDTVLVRTPDDAPDLDPTAHVFGASAPRALHLAHFGRFWLYRLRPRP